MLVDPGSFDYGMSLGMDVDMGMGMDAGHGGEMERNPSPLPDIESGLFADFSFGSSNTTSVTSFDSSSSAVSESSHHKSPSPVLAPIDTSISPLDAEQPSALSAASTSASTSTSASASPAPSVSDVLPEMSSINMGMGTGVGMGPLDCLYPSMHAMGSYMEMDMMYGYEMDPVVSQQETVHSPKPMRTPTATEASFAELAGVGAY